STPAQMFHMLRRQMLRRFRKPLVVMTPKSLLRHPMSVSSLEELQQGSFRTLIDDVDEVEPKTVRRIVLSSGKVYFDLLKEQRESQIKDIALVRLEQLYPFPVEEYDAIISRYPNAREIVWCQEEPQNQGAWYQIRHQLERPLSADHELLYAGRAPAAAPATGIAKIHDAEQKSLVGAALRAQAREESARKTKRLASDEVADSVTRKSTVPKKATTTTARRSRG
ncbi:MAG: hypothetical protein ACO3OV_09860, partial [Steroidobacteraceae bacterium]